MSENTVITKKRAFGIIIPLFLVSALLAGAFISVANDMYAFVKPDRAATVTVSESIDAKQLSTLLREKGIIKNDLVFRLYMKAKGKDDDVPLVLGEWSLNSNMSYREIILEIF